MTRTALKMESLETREVMSNVTANVVAGDLNVTGDNGGSDLEIRQLDHDSYRVTAKNGTGINGIYPNWWGSGSLQFDFHGVTDDVRINMNGGNDRVTIGANAATTHVRDDLAVNMGGGHDTLNLYRVAAGDDMWLNGSSGGDKVYLYGSDSGTRTADGDVALDYFEDIDVIHTDVDRALTVYNPNATGTVDVYLYGVDVGQDLRVTTGHGRDDIDIVGTQIRDDLLITTGNGGDRIDVVSTQIADDTELFVGGQDFGNDRITLTNSSTRDRLHVGAGHGDDVLDLNNFDGTRAYLYGEGGDDRLDMDAASRFTGTFVNAF